MFIRKYVIASVFGCLALPGLALSATATSAPPLVITSAEAQQVPSSLQAFIQRVWQESPVMQGAQASLEASQARSEGAGKPLYNPSLELDAERTDINTLSVGLSQTIDWSDQQEAQVNIADQQILAARAGLWQVRQSIATETLNALSRYTTALEMQALAQRRSELMKGFVDTVMQRQAAGDMGALDGTLAQVTYSEALMQEAAVESELAEAEAALQAVTGLTLEHWPRLPAELMAPPARIDQKLLQGLPSLTVLRGGMDAARARVKLVERSNRANPTVGLRAGREDSELLLGLSLEIPLFVRNNFQTEVRAASHDAVAEELVYRDAYRRAQARLNGSLGRFRNTARAWQTWQQAGQKAQREQMDLLEQMWQAGELTATDYLIQAKQNIDTQAAATALMGEVWQSAIAWLDASGQVEQWLGLKPTAIETNSGEMK